MRGVSHEPKPLCAIHLSCRRGLLRYPYRVAESNLRYTCYVAENDLRYTYRVAKNDCDTNITKSKIASIRFISTTEMENSVAIFIAPKP